VVVKHGTRSVNFWTPNATYNILMTLTRHNWRLHYTEPFQGPYNESPEPENVETLPAESWDLVLETILDRVKKGAEKLSKKFKKSKKVMEESRPEDNCKPGNEMAQELTEAWNLYTRVRLHLTSTHSTLTFPSFFLLSYTKPCVFICYQFISYRQTRS
jgi:hypothetical protein